MNQNSYHSLLFMFALAAIVCLPLLVQPSQATAKMDKPTVQVFLNGNPLSFFLAPYMRQNHTLVPVRDFLTALGADVHWNPTNKTITASQHDTRLILQLSSRQAKINSKSYMLPLPVQLNQGMAYAPLRVLAEAFDAKVDWHHADRSVRIRTILSAQGAEQLVREHLGIPLDSRTMVEYDYEENGAYVIHVYDWVQLEGQAIMTETQGWYQVDAETREIQSMLE